MRRLCLFVALLLAGCGGRPAGDPHTIKVVSSLPLTGSSRLQAETMVRAIEMAVAETHVPGFRLEYSSWDDATAQAGSWDPAKEKENASRAASDPDVMAYVGTYNSGSAKLAIPILNQAGLAMVSPGNTYSGLTKAGLGEVGEPELYYPTGVRNFSRVVPADDLQGKAGAWWAAHLGLHSVFILDDKELYGRGLARVFEAECTRLGLEVLGHEGIDAKSPDFRAVMNKIRESGAELVYFGGTIQNGAGKLVKDLHEVGGKALFMGPDGLKETAFIQAAGPAAEGTLVTLGGLPPEQMSPAAQRWLKAYEARYGSPPEAYAIYAYEAARVALRGIARVGAKDRDRIRREIMATSDYDGLLGRWSFDANGDTTLTDMSGYVVKGGVFQFAEALHPGQPVPVVRSTRVARGPSRSAGTALGEQLANGLSNGALIAVIALGYTLVYGLIELVNFAHGDVFVFGAFTALSALGAGWPLPAALAASMSVGGVLNWGLDRLAYRPLRNAPPLVPMIAAIGVSFILKNVAGYWKGWAPLSFPDVLDTGSSRALVVLATLPLLAGMHLFITRTRLGRAMRAVAQDRDAAQLMGVDMERTIGWAFFLGGALAGAAGLLYGLYNHEVRFDLGFRQGLNAFTAAVLGGIGNPTGAVLGGLIIGVVESLTAYYLSQALAPAMVFAVLIAIVLVRPYGLLGVATTDKV